MFLYDPSFVSLIDFYLSPVMAGVILCFWVFILLALAIKHFSHTRIMIAFDLFYEKVHTFYSEILGPEASKNMRFYITALFFVILFANLIGVMVDFIAPIFGINAQGEFVLSEYIILPTSDVQFSVALSLFSTFLLIYVQFGAL